jgi:hypothetical protein
VTRLGELDNFRPLGDSFWPFLQNYTSSQNCLDTFSKKSYELNLTKTDWVTF